MAKTSLCAVPLALAIAASSLSAAQPSSVAVGRDPEAKVLWFQNDRDSAVGVVSQNFEASFDAYDNQGADDFLVPQGEVWVIKQIQVTGTYFSGTGPARSHNLYFHRNEDGRPGRVIATYLELVGDPHGGNGEFLFTLPEPLKLKQGKHWLSVQVNMDFADAGQWGWETRSTQEGRPAVWKNPGDGFDTGCISYQRLQHCIGPLGEGPDFMFALYGKRRGSP